jgi:hypothetical protein
MQSGRDQHAPRPQGVAVNQTDVEARVGAGGPADAGHSSRDDVGAVAGDLLASEPQELGGR